MLEVSRLCRCYSEFKAADDVSFTIQNGELVGLDLIIDAENASTENANQEETA